MKRPIEEHWLYRLTNTNACCVVVGTAFFAWDWSIMDHRSRMIVVIGLSIAAVRGFFSGMYRYYRKRHLIARVLAAERTSDSRR